MDILLGLQWGDEGKGKIIDYLAPKYDIIARFQGGPNAGHTLYFRGKKYVLHQIPSGIFRKNIKNIIGNGMVLDLVSLKKEIEELKTNGCWNKDNLFIAKKAHLVLPSHCLLDQFYENQKGNRKIGSTLRGIGPAYTDKISRQGLRVGDLLLPKFMTKYENIVRQHQQLMGINIYDNQIFRKQEQDFFDAAAYIKTLNLIESEYTINIYIEENKNILAEGAQGSLLDVDFGTYPYVTSSNTMSSSVGLGLGTSPKNIKNILGLFKSYITRVGSGPFPTELQGSEGKKMQTIGNEFGATTGRPRRCGWLDLPLLKYAVILNGVTELIITKVDVLNTFKEISICTHYELINGEITDQVPFDLDLVKKPVYKQIKGWNCDLKGLNYNNLPQEFIEYLKLIEDYVKVPINFISIGPNREEIINRN